MNRRAQESHPSNDVDYPEVITSLGSARGRKWLEVVTNDAAHNTPVVRSLFDSFEKQATGSFCGVCSVTVILNALLRLPKEKRLEQFETLELCGPSQKWGGLTIQQVHKMFQRAAPQAQIESVLLADEAQVYKKFRADLMRVFYPGSNTGGTRQAIMVNLWRDLRGPRSGWGYGHHTPIAGFRHAGHVTTAAGKHGSGSGKTKANGSAAAGKSDSGSGGDAGSGSGSSETSDDHDDGDAAAVVPTEMESGDDDVDEGEWGSDATEQVLLLDVSLNADPHWIPLRTLCCSMTRVDTSSGTPRGYLLITIP